MIPLAKTTYHNANLKKLKHTKCPNKTQSNKYQTNILDHNTPHQLLTILRLKHRKMNAMAKT